MNTATNTIMNTATNTIMNTATNTTDWATSAEHFVGIDALRRAVEEYADYTAVELRDAYAHALYRAQSSPRTGTSRRRHEQNAARISHVLLARQIMRDAA